MSDCMIFRREEADENRNSGRCLSYAMAYVPVQRWENPMPAREALACGTAFASLVKPFGAMEVCR